jgi:hypothetical protein
MLKSFLHKHIRRMEQRFAYDAGYLHGVVDVSPAAFFKFARAQRLGHYRQSVTKDAWYAAKLAAALSEDCGPCAQLCVDMALADGVAAAKLAALLRGDIEQSGEDAALGYYYGMAVATNADTALSLVERVRLRFGAKGLLSLAFAVTSLRMYPTLKRGLGQGATCTTIVVSDANIAVKRAA